MKIPPAIKENLKYHFADSTSIQTMSTPIAAAFEVFVSGIPIQTSINARILSYGLTYAGFGRVYSKGLDKSRKLFHINSETKERIKQLHDSAYATAYCLAMTPPFYYLAGVRDLKQIALGTASSMVLGAAMGAPAGWAMDIFRDFTGLKESERLPQFVKRQSRKVKIGLAAILAAGCIGATAAVYEVSDMMTSNDNQVLAESR